MIFFWYFWRNKLNIHNVITSLRHPFVLYINRCLSFSFMVFSRLLLRKNLSWKIILRWLDSRLCIYTLRWINTSPNWFRHILLMLLSFRKMWTGPCWFDLIVIVCHLTLTDSSVSFTAQRSILLSIWSWSINKVLIVIQLRQIFFLKYFLYWWKSSLYIIFLNLYFLLFLVGWFYNYWWLQILLMTNIHIIYIILSHFF
jgi:hypothetical protein